MNHHNVKNCKGCGIKDWIMDKAGKLNNFLKEKQYATRALKHISNPENLAHKALVLAE